MENEQVLGLDLGTNSIGAALRQGKEFTWGAVYTFSKGFGMSKSGEFSLASQRTTYRSKRRLYNSRRYRKWALLEVLINHDYCPLDEKTLDTWRYYSKGIGRKYPVDHIEFQNWIKMDFDGDGVHDYSSPYQLRAILADNEVDLFKKTDRYKIGRVLYHMAMRRGFKSSRKSGKNEESSVYKGSKETTATPYDEYKEQVALHGTLGKYIASIENGDTRLRNRYTLRSDYLKEFKTIMAKQDLQNSAFANACEKALFFQRPLRSQKGVVGKCPLEPDKARCPESHPDFELFRAYQFLNNLKYKNEQNEFVQIPKEWIKAIFDKKFKTFYQTCKFGDIRAILNELAGKELELNYKRKRDQTTVSLCPVRSRIESVFGDYDKIKVAKSKGSKSTKTYYDGEDIWHALFHFEDKEIFEQYCKNQLQLSDKDTKSMLTGWNDLRVGYSNLSLKAIRKILVPLKLGSVYSEAVLLAKVIDFIGQDQFESDYDLLVKKLDLISAEIEFDRISTRLANKLIFLSKIEEDDDSFNENFVEEEAVTILGKAKWKEYDETKQSSIVQDTLEKFEIHRNQKADGTAQSSTVSSKNTVIEFAKALKEFYQLDQDEVSQKLYHHSNISYYPDIKSDPNKDNQLPSPVIPALKNPAAYKTLHKLRKIINELLSEGIIDEHTRIVIEVAKSMSSKNERNAIEKFQNENARVNASAIAVLIEAAKDSNFSGLINPKSARDLEKFKLWMEQIPEFEETVNEIRKNDDALIRYKLWKEQNGICLYSGKPISFTALFSPNLVDFEHTIPRSICYDNSLANRTVTFREVNTWKNNRIPTELENYNKSVDDRGVISERLNEWRAKEERLDKSIKSLSSKIKATEDPDRKAKLIQDRHVKKFEHEYWERKLKCFEIEKDKVDDGFRNSQLIDTQIITKYAFHFLKSVFYRVDPQVGQTTSLFKEIYSVGEPKEDKKDRSKHTHHLEDAAVLTLVPRRTRLKKIMEAYFKAKENDTDFYTGHLTVDTSGVSTAIRDMVANTFVNNLSSQDRILAEVKKKVRKRGEIQYLDYSKNNPKIATGDAVRGQLHSETFYGMIKVAAKDENGSLLREADGAIIYEKDKKGNEVYKMVGRKSIMDVNFKTDLIIDSQLGEHLKKQLDSGIKQNELQDFQGNTVRHIRCEVKSGRGVMNPDNATIVKRQTYLSEKEYKNNYYTDSGDNYMFGLYENENGRKIVPVNIFESTKLSLDQNDDSKRMIFKSKEPVMIGRGKKAKESYLKHIFMAGQKILFFLENKEELKELNKYELGNRLYFIKRLYQPESGNIVFQHHLESRGDSELSKLYGSKGRTGFSIKEITHDFSPPRILFTPTKDFFITEGKEFQMNLDGSITYLF